ncbi:MAG: TIM barrel protein [Terriglobia bacterium]
MKKAIMNRRDFVGTLAATAAMLEPAARGVAKPQEQRKSSGMKVGLYSITYLGVWYRGKALTLEEVIQRAKQYGYDGVEFDGKRPHANPLDLPTSRCRELRRIADGEGIEIFGVAANNDFSSPIPEHRECQICYVRELVRVTADLGAKTLRLFFAWPGITKHPQVANYEIAKRVWRYTHRPFTTEETWAWCREGLVESARYAADACAKSIRPP